MMNVQRLRYFVIVTEELNFARAATRFHMAHSLMSFQIRHSEEPGERLTALREAGSQA